MHRVDTTCYNAPVHSAAYYLEHPDHLTTHQWQVLLGHGRNGRVDGRGSTLEALRVRGLVARYGDERAWKLTPDGLALVKRHRNKMEKVLNEARRFDR